MTRRSVGASIIFICENIKLSSLLTSSSKLLRASCYSLLRPTVGRIDDPREVGQATYSRFFGDLPWVVFYPLPAPFSSDALKPSFPSLPSPGKEKGGDGR